MQIKSFILNEVNSTATWNEIFVDGNAKISVKKNKYTYLFVDVWNIIWIAKYMNDIPFVFPVVIPATRLIRYEIIDL